MIPPIGGLAPLTPPVAPPATAGSSGAASAPAAAGSDSFSNVVTNAVDALQQAQTSASTDEAQAAAGQGNLADTMVAATQASLDTEVTTSLLSQATTAYNGILNMSF